MEVASQDEGPYIKLEGTIQSPDCNPTHQQRAVWRFYESRNSDEADDIYSLEWYHRTLSFFKKFARKNKTPKVLGSWKMIENLEFGPFFLSHPIAAYALWHMLQAFYDLDHAVCGTSEEAVAIIEQWKEIPPFVYLNTKRGKEGKKIRVKWAESLQQLKKEIECGDLEGEELFSRLASILVAVQKMERAFDAMKENFAENLNGMVFVDEMIKKVGAVVDERKRIIMDLLRPGDENQTPTSDSDGKTDSSSSDASPVEPQISFGEQAFPDWRPEEYSSESIDRYDALVDTLATAMKVSISCIFIYLALLYLINLRNLYEI